MTPVGFSHSEISGSKPVCDSPELIAANYVLHRLLTPRHPSCALSSLTTNLWLDGLCHQNYRDTPLAIARETLERLHVSRGDRSRAMPFYAHPRYRDRSSSSELQPFGFPSTLVLLKTRSRVVVIYSLVKEPRRPFRPPTKTTNLGVEGFCQSPKS